MKKLFFETSKLPHKEIAPGIRIRPVHLDNLTVTYVDLDPGAVLKEHSHPNDQVTSILKGVLRLTLEGVAYDVGPGQTLTIPSGKVHSGVVIEGPVFAIDCFSPKRHDYVIE